MGKDRELQFLNSKEKAGIDDGGKAHSVGTQFTAVLFRIGLKVCCSEGLRALKKGYFRKNVKLNTDNKKTGQVIRLGKKIAVILGILLALLLIRHGYLYHLLEIKTELAWLRETLGWKGLILGGLIYMILLSIPFFPGVEVGWLLIMLFQKEGVIIVYFFTVCGLCISFFIGRWLESSQLAFWLDLNSLKRAFYEKSSKIAANWSRLISRHPHPSDTTFKNYFSKYRYVLLAILINTPGNSLIGGGGGISFICGMNQGFSWKGFIATIVVATSPVPILLFFGFLHVETFTTSKHIFKYLQFAFGI